MNCLSKKVRLRKEQMVEERRKAEEDQYLNSLSEEERIAYHKSVEERGKRAIRLLASTMAISMGAYDAMAEKAVNRNNSKRSNGNNKRI